jgi:ABC-2 type transport system ATP-binding protein
MSAREVLRYVASFHGPVDSGYVEQLLLRVGISEAADRPTAGFSGGMRQRLGIAQALVGRPAVVLLDEPASALDPVGRAEVLELLRDLRGETTIFYSTHILADVERVSDHVTVLHQGRLVASAPTGELLGRFTAGQLLIRTRGENDLSVALRDLPGVRELASSVEGGELRSYELTAEPGALGEIQRRVTQLAAERGLALLSNEERRLDLEAVFLRLIGVGPVDKVA